MPGQRCIFDGILLPNGHVVLIGGQKVSKQQKPKYKQQNYHISEAAVAASAASMTVLVRCFEQRQPLPAAAVGR